MDAPQPPTNAPKRVHFATDAPNPPTDARYPTLQELRQQQLDRVVTNGLVEGALEPPTDATEPEQVCEDLATLVHVLHVHGDRIVHGDKTWLPIRLCGLSFRFQEHRQGGIWCCVQCTGIIIGGKMYKLSLMDAHISIGTWLNHTAKCAKFDRMLDRCSKYMAEVAMLDFEVAFNERICCDHHLVFQFSVSSKGGKVLHALSQRLNQGGIHQLERPPRGMSPPGQVFHLSVYMNRY